MRILPSVIEAVDPPEGLVEIKVKDARGKRIGFLQVSADDLDDELVEALVDWQARHSHEGGSLSIIRGGVSSELVV